jgi:outer membrane protein TolC
MQDGSDMFLRRSLANSSMGLSLSKIVGFTGGQLFVKSDLQRIDNFSDTTKQYMTTPISVGFNQPLFSYNPYKWSKKIEPLKYQEAEKQFIEDMENVSIAATNVFFDLLLAQITIEVSKTNQANNDTLFKIAKGRFNLGKIAENELLQLELSLLNSNSQLEQAKIDYEARLFKFKSFLGIKEVDKIEIVPPTNVPGLKIEVQKALVEAKQNRAQIVSFERQIIEAQSGINQAKAENRFNVNLFAMYGLSQSAYDDLSAAYKNPQDMQQLTVGVQVPILNWGVGKGKVKMAQSKMELTKTTVEQALTDFEQEIFLSVMGFNMQQSQLFIASKADTIGQKRYFVTKQRYLIGKIAITELNIASAEKDLAKQSYVAALRNFWKGFYEIRKLTLFDFVENKQITIDFETLK